MKSFGHYVINVIVSVCFIAVWVRLIRDHRRILRTSYLKKRLDQTLGDLLNLKSELEAVKENCSQEDWKILREKVCHLVSPWYSGQVESLAFELERSGRLRFTWFVAPLREFCFTIRDAGYFQMTAEEVVTRTIELIDEMVEERTQQAMVSLVTLNETLG